MPNSKFNAADYLESPEDIAAYLDAALEENDPKLLAAALGDISRSKGMTMISKETGITRKGLYKALSADGDPKLTTLVGVLNTLGLRLSVTPLSN